MPGAVCTTGRVARTIRQIVSTNLLVFGAVFQFFWNAVLENWTKHWKILASGTASLPNSLKIRVGRIEDRLAGVVPK